MTWDGGLLGPSFRRAILIFIFLGLSHDVGWWALGLLVSAGHTRFYFPRAISQRGVVGLWAPRLGGPHSFLFPSGHLTTWDGGPLGSSFRRATLIFISLRPSHDVGWWVHVTPRLGGLFVYSLAISRRGMTGPWAPRFGGRY